MKTIEYENLHFLNKPFFDEYKKSFNEVLERGWFILGKNVEVFEQQFAAYLGCGKFLGVASGLDALELPLIAFGFPENSEIIVPSNTYIATINAIINTGHVPVFVEPDIKTYNIDPGRIEEKISPKTKAIMIVHLYGMPCEMDPIAALCKKYDLKLIEDCAQSHGAKYKGVMTGTFGEANAFSFYPTKNLGALGDAGGISIYDDELYNRMKALRNYGSFVKYKNEFIGYNSRLDEVQAGFLSAKLKRLDEINTHKNKLASIYFSNLKSDFILPYRDSDFYNVFHIFPVRHKRRDELKKYLLEREIKTEVHYPIAPCDQKSIKDYFAAKSLILKEEDFNLSREIHATELSLPCSSIHTEEDILHVTEVMNQF
jgi:dTDP-4-amino-4,6-dideoxygalactose transaminase